MNTLIARDMKSSQSCNFHIESLVGKLSSTPKKVMNKLIEI